MFIVPYREVANRLVTAIAQHVDDLMWPAISYTGIFLPPKLQAQIENIAMADWKITVESAGEYGSIAVERRTPYPLGQQPKTELVYDLKVRMELYWWHPEHSSPLPYRLSSAVPPEEQIQKVTAVVLQVLPMLDGFSLVINDNGDGLILTPVRNHPRQFI